MLKIVCRRAVRLVRSMYMHYYLGHSKVKASYIHFLRPVFSGKKKNNSEHIQLPSLNIYNLLTESEEFREFAKPGGNILGPTLEI